jgi:hypothetical protein
MQQHCLQLSLKTYHARLGLIQLKFGRMSAPRLPQSEQRKRSSRSESRASSDQESPLIASSGCSDTKIDQESARAGREHVGKGDFRRSIIA